MRMNGAKAVDPDGKGVHGDTRIIGQLVHNCIGVIEQHPTATGHQLQTGLAPAKIYN